jgi:MarR family transcriptional regulator, repressor for mepA
MTLIDEFGALFIASRMERLAVILRKEAVVVFGQYLSHLKYKWYPPLYVIKKKNTISVVELANELSYAHPTIIEILRELEQQKLIKSHVDKHDQRRRILSLTPKGKSVFDEMLPVIEAFEKAITAVLDKQPNLLEAIQKVESDLQQTPFSVQVARHL